MTYVVRTKTTDRITCTSSNFYEWPTVEEFLSFADDLRDAVAEGLAPTARVRIPGISGDKAQGYRSFTVVSGGTSRDEEVR